MLIGYEVRVLWMLMVGGWLFLLSNPNTCFLLLAALAEMEGRKEGRKDKETSEPIKTVAERT